MKLFNVLFVLLLAVLFNCNVIAQEFSSLRGGYEIKLPPKIQKLVLDPLPAGTYTIGSGGYFPTIDSAFKKLSIDGIAGEVVLELIDELYTSPTDSFGFFINGPIVGTSENSRVIIKPSDNKNVVIESHGWFTMSFWNTSYVTIDGISLTGSTTLTIHTFQNTIYPWNEGIDFLDNSDYNIIQNTIFLDEDYSRAGGAIGLFSFTTNSPSTDNNLIQNNFIKSSGIAIYFSAVNSSNIAFGNIIRNNIIGSETDSLINWGVQIEKNQNSIVENNIIQNINGRYSGFDITHGINLYGSTGCIIRNNIVHNINSGITNKSTGILLSGDLGYTGNSNQVYNNMIYDIQNTSHLGSGPVAGIQMWRQNNPKIYFNTILLNERLNTFNSANSAALLIESMCNGIDARNNVFANRRDESPYCASSIRAYSGFATFTSDYNDLFYEPNQYNCLVRFGSDFHTLADWQTTGKDLNSLNECLNFVSETDLHINTNYCTLLDGRGTPIMGIDVDFDGDTRNTNTPDIGADEFDLSSSATNWQPQNLNFPSGIMVEDLSAPNDMVCWAVGVDAVLLSPYAGFSRTTDGGNTWIYDTIADNWTGILPMIFAIDENTAFVASYVTSGGDSKGIYKTTDGGLTWNRQNAYNNSLYGAGYIHFFDSQNGVAIGDPNLETYTTTNGGENWNSVTMPAAWSEEYTWNSGNGITAYGNTIWFSTGARVFKSTDKGNTWNVILSEPQYLMWWPCIAFQDESNGIYSLKRQGQLDHIYRKTTDGGVTWTTISNQILDNLAPTGIQHIKETSTFIVSGGMPQGMRGIAVTYDEGDSWTLIDTIGHNFIEFPSEMVGWGSEYNNSEVSKYVGPRITTVKEENVDIVPAGYSLSQNYPNPFNPSTTFRYSIPTQSKVVIKVFDILGKEVATLMDEEKPAGTYELTWNVQNLSSGIYFYQLKAGEFVQTRKMLLIK